MSMTADYLTQENGVDAQQEFNRELSRRLEEVQNGLSYFMKEIALASDPISPILSDKGVWLMNSPIIPTKELKTAFARLMAQDISKRSSGKYRVTSVRVSNTRFDFTIEGPNESRITWAALSSGVVVEQFDRLIGINKRIGELDEELKEIKKEFREAAIITNSKDAMLSNGYYTLYLKSVFTRKKFREAVKDLEDEYREAMAVLEAEREALVALSAKINADRSTAELLKFMSNHYLKFPRITGLDAYERSLNINNKETTDGT